LAVVGSLTTHSNRNGLSGRLAWPAGQGDETAAMAGVISSSPCWPFIVWWSTPLGRRPARCADTKVSSEAASPPLRPMRRWPPCVSRFRLHATGKRVGSGACGAL